MAATQAEPTATPSLIATSEIDLVRITSEPLEPLTQQIQSLVGSEAAGAISVFIGTTRDSFQGKQVVRLEYEAYEPMALKQLSGLCSQMRHQWPNITKCAIFHRIGTVEVGEASVVIAVSSPHRREALESVSWCIDELKRVVVIWKKELYVDGSVWKENAEWRQQQDAIKNKLNSKSG